jgi:selenocysteine-specific elongation factor
VTAAHAGARFALALADVAPDDVPRAATIVTDEGWHPTRRVIVRIDAGDYAPRRHASVQIAAARCSARVSDIDPAQRVARIALGRPLVARACDRVVLRTGPGAEGVLGGEVVDPFPERHSIPPGPGASDAARLESIAVAAGERGVSLAALPLRLGVSPQAVEAVVASASVLLVGERVYAHAVVNRLEARVVAVVAAWSTEHPFADGVSTGEIGTIANVERALAERVIARAAAAGRLTVDRGMVAVRGAVLPERAAALLARVLHAVSAAGLEPPTVAELADTYGAEVEAAIRHAERAGNLIRVGGVRCYAGPVLARVIERLGTAMRPGREYSPSELRDVLGISRKYLIPLLEYCDSIGVTERRSGGRVLVDVSSR